MSILNEISQLKIIQSLSQKRKVKTYLVGGFLRDKILKRVSFDLDFAVEKNALKFAEEFADKIKGAYVLLDEEHGCARVVRKEGEQIYTFDFADFRAEDIGKDLASRDFTINTLIVSINDLTEKSDWDKSIEDPKRALKDIASQRIQRVSIRSLRDDPLRMLRAFAHMATLGFRIELSTLNQISKERELLSSVSPERIREEFFKILNSDNCIKVLKLMDKVKILETIIPQIKVMYNCPQGEFHHLDVWPHSLEAVFQMDKLIPKLETRSDIKEYLNAEIAGGHTRRSVIKFAALLHDIGKPDTRKIEEKRYTFHGHEHAGQNITREIALMLKLSTKERFALEDMVLYHLRPGFLSNYKVPSEKAYYRYFRDVKDEAASVAILAMADQRATRGPLTTKEKQEHHEAICQELLERFFNKQKEEPFVPLLNGDDLIKHFKLKPSPIFKKILDAAQEEQVLGKITTKEEALELAEKFVEK